MRFYTSKFAALTAGFLLLISAGSLAAEIPASGQVSSEGSPVVFARVIILETGYSVRSDENGNFSFTVPQDGFYTFRIITPDGIIQQRKNITYAGQNINLALDQSGPGKTQTTAITKDQGLLITGDRDRTKLSRYTLNQDEIKRLPGVYGDSLKAIQTLPGISPALPIGVLPSVNLLTFAGVDGLGAAPYSNSSSGIIVIRGAGTRGSQFLFDGFKIQYPFHLGDQSSVINNDLIQSVDVYTGTYPIRYGNATGGIVAITAPSKVEKPAGHVNVALFLTDAHYETPVFDSGFIIAAGRKSYPNFALLKTYPDGIPPNAKYANYEDGQFKMHLESDTGMHAFDAIYFGARDRLDYTQAVAEADRGYSDSALELAILDQATGGLAGFNSNSDTRPPVGLDRRFNTTGSRYTLQTSFSRSTVQVQTTRFKEEFELDFRTPGTGEPLFEFVVLNARQETELRSDHQIEILKNHIYLQAGFEKWWYRWELSIQNLSPRQSVNPDTPDFAETVNQLIESNRTFRALYDGDRTIFETDSAFAELELLFWRFRLTPGIRSDHYSLSKATGIGPRIGAEFSIQETGTTLLASGSRHFNLPPGLEQISIEAGNPDLLLEEADHVAGGIEQTIGKHWLIKIEGYRNTYRNLVVSDQYNVQPNSLRTNLRDLVEIPGQIAQDPLEARPLFFSNDGTGISEGVELFIKKTREPSANGWFGWLSYTVSWTKRNNHQPRLTDEQQAERNRANLNRKAIAYLPYGKNAFIYYDNGESEIIYDNDEEELYDLDRTHQVSLVLNYKLNSEWQFGMRYRHLTGTPYTPVIRSEGVGDTIRTYIPEYSKYYQSARLPDFHQLDLRIDRFLNYNWGFVNYYIEFINLYARRNVERYNFNFLYPFLPGVNPEPSYESTYIEAAGSGGKSKRIPLINIGIEVRF